MRRRTAIAIAVIVASWSAMSSGSAPARALWSQPVHDATAAAGSLVLAGPSGLGASGACSILVIGPAVELTWTATPSSFASGYDVLRSTSPTGPFVTVATVAGATTVTFTDTGLPALTTYHYRLRSRAGAWESPVTSTASATTPLICL